MLASARGSTASIDPYRFTGRFLFYRFIFSVPRHAGFDQNIRFQLQAGFAAFLGSTKKTARRAAGALAHKGQSLRFQPGGAQGTQHFHQLVGTLAQHKSGRHPPQRAAGALGHIPRWCRSQYGGRRPAPGRDFGGLP